MQLYALGLNHHTAPLAVREQVAFDPRRLPEALVELTHGHSVREAAILSTCNRTELYCTGATPEAAAQWLADYHRLEPQKISPYLYTLPSRDAVRHMFRVASGLDSMVLGEPQILGQMKQAARMAENAGTLGTLLHKLFQKTFAVAKEVRSTTAIGANIVSMAAATVHLAERIFENLADRRCCSSAPARWSSCAPRISPRRSRNACRWPTARWSAARRWRRASAATPCASTRSASAWPSTTSSSPARRAPCRSSARAWPSGPSRRGATGRW
jgi:hypothetical protein